MLKQVQIDWNEVQLSAIEYNRTAQNSEQPLHAIYNSALWPWRSGPVHTTLLLISILDSNEILLGTRYFAKIDFISKNDFITNKINNITF